MAARGVGGKFSAALSSGDEVPADTVADIVADVLLVAIGVTLNRHQWSFPLPYLARYDSTRKIPSGLNIKPGTFKSSDLQASCEIQTIMSVRPVSYNESVM